MTTRPPLLRWAPRALGLLMTLYLALFALDAFSTGGGIAVVLRDLGIHLIPALVVLGIVIVSWRRPLMGAGGFTLLALLYAATTVRAHPDWAVAIAGPLLVIGSLYLLQWRGASD